MPWSTFLIYCGRLNVGSILDFLPCFLLASSFSQAMGMGNETNDVFVTLEILLDYEKPAPYCDVEKKINVQRSQFPKLMFV